MKQSMQWYRAAALLSGAMLSILSVQVLPADDFMTPAMQSADLLERLDGPRPPLIVDLRSPVEFRIAHLPGAVNIPLPELEQRLDELRPNPPADVLIYCLNGSRTRKAETLLTTGDLDRIYHLEGSLERWLKQGYPIEKGGPAAVSWH